MDKKINLKTEKTEKLENIKNIKEQSLNLTQSGKLLNLINELLNSLINSLFKSPDTSYFLDYKSGKISNIKFVDQLKSNNLNFFSKGQEILLLFFKKYSKELNECGLDLSSNQQASRLKEFYEIIPIEKKLWNGLLNDITKRSVELKTYEADLNRYYDKILESESKLLDKHIKIQKKITDKKDKNKELITKLQDQITTSSRNDFKEFFINISKGKNISKFKFEQQSQNKNVQMNQFADKNIISNYKSAIENNATLLEDLKIETEKLSESNIIYDELKSYIQELLKSSGTLNEDFDKISNKELINQIKEFEGEIYEIQRWMQNITKYQYLSEQSQCVLNSSKPQVDKSILNDIQNEILKNNESIKQRDGLISDEIKKLVEQLKDDCDINEMTNQRSNQSNSEKEERVAGFQGIMVQMLTDKLKEYESNKQKLLHITTQLANRNTYLVDYTQPNQHSPTVAKLKQTHQELKKSNAISRREQLFNNDVYQKTVHPESKKLKSLTPNKSKPVELVSDKMRIDITQSLKKTFYNMKSLNESSKDVSPFMKSTKSAQNRANVKLQEQTDRISKIESKIDQSHVTFTPSINPFSKEILKQKTIEATQKGQDFVKEYIQQKKDEIQSKIKNPDITESVNFNDSFSKLLNDPNISIRDSILNEISSEFKDGVIDVEKRIQKIKDPGYSVEKKANIIKSSLDSKQNINMDPIFQKKDKEEQLKNQSQQKQLKNQDKSKIYAIKTNKSDNSQLSSVDLTNQVSKHSDKSGMNQVSDFNLEQVTKDDDQVEHTSQNKIVIPNDTQPANSNSPPTFSLFFNKVNKKDNDEQFELQEKMKKYENMDKKDIKELINNSTNRLCSRKINEVSNSKKTDNSSPFKNKNNLEKINQSINRLQTPKLSKSESNGYNVEIQNKKTSFEQKQIEKKSKSNSKKVSSSFTNFLEKSLAKKINNNLEKRTENEKDHSIKSKVINKSIDNNSLTNNLNSKYKKETPKKQISNNILVEKINQIKTPTTSNSKINKNSMVNSSNSKQYDKNTPSNSQTKSDQISKTNTPSNSNIKKQPINSYLEVHELKKISKRDSDSISNCDDTENPLISNWDKIEGIVNYVDSRRTSLEDKEYKLYKDKVNTIENQFSKHKTDSNPENISSNSNYLDGKNQDSEVNNTKNSLQDKINKLDQFKNKLVFDHNQNQSVRSSMDEINKSFNPSHSNELNKSNSNSNQTDMKPVRNSIKDMVGKIRNSKNSVLKNDEEKDNIHTKLDKLKLNSELESPRNIVPNQDIDKILSRYNNESIQAINSDINNSDDELNEVLNSERLSKDQL